MSETINDTTTTTSTGSGFQIIREWGINGDKRKRYNLCEGPGKNLSDMAGQRIEVAAYVEIETPDPSTGEIRRVLKFLTTDGECLGTRSNSFISGFERFLACMESDECTEFEVVKARSSQGRNYILFKA